jgi:hypothetical protein
MGCSSSTHPGFGSGAGVEPLKLAPSGRARPLRLRHLAVACCAIGLPTALWGCAPGGGLADPSGARGYWATETTKSPPAPDADPVAPDDPEPTAPDPTPVPPGSPASVDARGPAATDPSPNVDARPPSTAGPDATPAQPPPTSPPAEGPPGVAGPCMFKFDITTSNAGGDYAPSNVGAIWISDGGNKFVKTLKIWANKRRRHLTKWNTASAQNTTDAVTGATLNSHGLRSATWDCSDVNHQSVPFGDYHVNIEFTESNGAGPSLSIPFPRNATAQTLTAPDQGKFKAAHIQVTP